MDPCKKAVTKRFGLRWPNSEIEKGCVVVSLEVPLEKISKFEKLDFVFDFSVQSNIEQVT